MSRNLGCLALCVAAVAVLASCPSPTDPTSPGAGGWTYTVTSLPADGIKTLDQSPAISWSVSGVSAIAWRIRIADSASGLSSAVEIDPTNAVFSDADAGYPWTTGNEIPLAADPGTTKYWQIRFDEGAGYSDWSPAYSFTVTVSPIITLTSPAGGIDTTDTTPTFSWESIEGAASYSLQISDSTPSVIYTAEPIEGGLTEYTIPIGDSFSLGSYSWVIKGYNDKAPPGSSVWSERRTFQVVSP